MMKRMSIKKIRLFYYMFLALCWIGLFTPTLVVIIVNWEKYFVQKSGWSIAMGGVYAILLIVLLFKFGSKKFNKVFWSTSVLVVIYCLNSIIQDMLLLTFMFWIGTVWFMIMEIPTNYFKNIYKAYKNAMLKEYGRKEALSQMQDNNNVEPQETTNSGRC